MKPAKLTAVLAAAKIAACVPFLEGRDTCTTNDLNLPSGGMRGYNGIYFGFLPDDSSGGGTATTMSTLNADTGKKASTYGRYSQLTGTTYNSQQLTSVLNDVVASGAVFVPAIMPTQIKFSAISADVATQIANALETFTSKGVEVWLRFAHEMNYYVSNGRDNSDGKPTYVGGTQAEFITAWQNVHAAVASNPKILMFWSPNVNDTSTLQGWWPGANYVDIVGMDIYPSAGTTFSDAFGPFYNAFAAKYNKHFCIGETGSHNGATVAATIAAKEAWVKQLANTDVSAFPCYRSASWFEYYKTNQDFRIIQDQSSATVKQTLSNFQ